MSDKVIQKKSAGGVLYHEGKYLTIKWGSERTYELPKGTIELGETPEETCVREMLEETGYNIRVTHLLNIATFTFKWHDGNTYEKTVYYFLVERIDDAEPIPSREEGEDFENIWLSYEDAIAQLSHQDMREAVELAHDIVG